MTLTSGLKRICDLSFYMTFATTIAWMVSSGEFLGLVLALPIFMATAFLSSYLVPKGTVRYLGLLPLLLIFVIVPITVISLAVLIPAIVLMIYNLPQTLEIDRRSNYQSTFRLFLGIFLGIIGLMFFVYSTSALMRNAHPDMTIFTNEVLVFALSFLVNSVVYMRMIRHDIAVQRQTRFKIINIIPVVAVAFLAIITGQPLARRVASMVIAGFLWLVSIPAVWIARLFSLPFRTLDSLFWDRARYYAAHLAEGLEYIEDFDSSMYYGAQNNVFFIIIGILVVIGIFIVYRWLMKNKEVAITVDKGLEEERFWLEKKALRSKNSKNQIRAIYQKFLKLLKQKNIQILASTTSFEAALLAKENANPETLSQLREAYVRIRYRESEYTKADLTHVKGLYKKIKEDFEN